MEFIKVQNKLYTVLGMYGGYAYLGLPLDVNNDVVKNGVIWEMQPFYWENSISHPDKIKILYFKIIRFFKKDCFGKSKFKTFINETKLNLLRILN
jgi:hypothetical protein